MEPKIKSPVGLYGKLPAHGDFIERNLSREFVDAWDNWLQQSILSSQSQLNENWLNTYMISPIWRFALSPGCLDQHPWLGIILPSVDSVGRYFPLTLTAKLPPNTPLFHSLQHHQDWFEQIETIALACLNEQPCIDEVMSVLAGHPLNIAQPKATSNAMQSTNQCSGINNTVDHHHQSLDDQGFTSRISDTHLFDESLSSLQDPLYESLIANSVDASQLDVATVSAFQQPETVDRNLNDTQTFDSQQLQNLIGLKQQENHNVDVLSSDPLDSLTSHQSNALRDNQSNTLSNHQTQSIRDNTPIHINQLHNHDWALTEAEAETSSIHFPALAERMLDTLLSQRHPSYSIWQTKGSEIVKPSLLCSPFLPQPSYFFAMMGGYWEQAKST